MAEAVTFSLLGKTIEMVDASESLTIRFTDGSYLEASGDTYRELNGDERARVDVYYKGQSVSGRAE